MKDIKYLKKDIHSLKMGIKYKLSRNIANSMLKETHLNFMKGAYMNDDRTEKWEPRLYDKIRTPSGRKLGYKPLLRTRSLYNSYKTVVRPKESHIEIGIKSNLSYAQVQNEGGQTKRRWRQPEYGINRKPPVIPARRHAGIGKRTIRRAIKEINMFFKKNIK